MRSVSLRKSPMLYLPAIPIRFRKAEFFHDPVPFHSVNNHYQVNSLKQLSGEVSS